MSSGEYPSSAVSAFLRGRRSVPIRGDTAEMPAERQNQRTAMDASPSGAIATPKPTDSLRYRVRCRRIAITMIMPTTNAIAMMIPARPM